MFYPQYFLPNDSTSTAAKRFRDLMLSLSLPEEREELRQQYKRYKKYFLQDRSLKSLPKPKHKGTSVEYETIYYHQILRETQKAFYINSVTLGHLWLPKAFCKHIKNDKQIIIPQWLYGKIITDTYSPFS